MTANNYFSGTGFFELNGADQVCQNAADSESLGGTWKAWLSVPGPGNSVADRIGNFKYYRLDGAPVADGGLADLMDGSIDNPINIAEDGITEINSNVWTGTLSSGDASGGNCNGWTSSNNDFWGSTGSSGTTGAGWTGTGGGNGCLSPARLYCFEQDITSVELTVSKTGTGSGTVTSNPAGINCGADCSESYTSGTIITLTATEAVGSTFVGWTNCTPLLNPLRCQITLSGDTEVTAQFELPPTAAINSPGAGDWRNQDFSMGYSANAATCQLETRNGATASWVNRGGISCGSGLTTTIQMPMWCSVEGTNECGVQIVAIKIPFSSEQDERNFSIDLTAPVITSFTASDSDPANTVALADDPLITAEGTITLKWGATDDHSGIKGYEVWRSPDGVGGWTNVSGAIAAGTTTYTDSPGGGEWWYGLHALDNGNLLPDENCITEAGQHCGGVSTDSLDASRTAVGPIRVVVDSTPPTVSFDTPPTPASGAVISGDFTLQYDATDNFSLPADMACELFISTNGGTNWASRGSAACGSNKTKTIEHAWCPTPGSTPNQCGVRITAKDQAGNTKNTERFYTFNQPPTVQPMVAIATFISDTLDLNATASDDGKLNPLTFSWTQVTGSGTANFADPSNKDTTVTFTNLGSYRLQLTVNDGFFTVSKHVDIIVKHEPPVADAGSDQTIPFGLPNVSTAIDGSASADDGFPDPPGALSYSWSGPAEVTFADSSAAVTTAAFSASGVYDLALEVSDGEFTDTDTVQITVLNARPVVNATPSQLDVDFALPIALSAAVTDDELPSPPNKLEFQWVKISGPGRADFSDPAGANTNVQLSQAGEYELAFQAFDGEKTGSDSIVVRYGAPERYGLVPCGLIIDDPATIGLDETDPCELKHTLVLLQRLVDFALWKLVPLTIAALVVATGAIFFFQLGGPEVMAKVRMIWSAVGKGVLILLFSWLFLNFLLGVLGFDINIFGRWYEISA